MEQYVIIALIALSVLLNIILIAQVSKRGGQGSISSRDIAEIKNSFSQNVSMISSALKIQAESSDKVLQVKIDAMNEKIKENTIIMAQRLDEIRIALERNVKNMQESNERKLAEIQKTVDDKLSQTLNARFKETFDMLLGQLESVTKTVGEMTAMSKDVGSLTKALTNVKTMGIFGEIQLGAIIEQILAPEQYAKNVITNKLSKEPVEFVIRLPGNTDEGEVLLPIDCKFPYTRYYEMQKAYESNDIARVEMLKKELVQTIKTMAKDIKQKYVCPPVTTNFAIMFLPVEGLYAEVVRLGLVQSLQSDYGITIAGPTTMSALLNSLQMGFQTLAVQKKSADVWTVLENVKGEFNKFQEVVDLIQRKFNSVSNDFETLVGKRTRQINRRLKDVSPSATLPPPEN